MTVRSLKRLLFGGAGTLSLLFFALIGLSPSLATDDPLARSRAMYAALNSYSDTGVVINEFGPASSPVKEQQTFTTYFRRTPRGFYFDFKKESGDRFVIWGDPDAFHTWWKTTGAESDFPNPNNIGAFATAEPKAHDAALKIPTLLYSKAPFQGAFTNFSGPTEEGTEEIGGHKCHRLVGTDYDVYGATGNKVNVRQMTVWIDDESFLIRKIIEVPTNTPPGNVNRVTTTFEPQANPMLDESKLKFIPPAK